MAFRQILQGRCSRFMLDHACKNSKIGVPRIPIPIRQFSSKLSTNPQPIRFNFNKRAYDEGWFHNSKGVGFTLFVFSLGAAVAISSGKWVKVPYTERKHLILFYKFMGRFISEELIEFEDEPLLPPNHPYTMSARRIFEDIMEEALPLEMEIKAALKKESKLTIEMTHEEKRSLNKMIDFKFRTEDDFVKKQEQEQSKEECEIIVVNSDEAAIASSGIFGKMYITSTLLHHYRKHPEMIATLIAHEAGHDMARHTEEQLSKFVSTVSVIWTSLYLFWQSTYIRSKSIPFFLLRKLGRYPFVPSLSFMASVGLLTYLAMIKYWRDMIMEADYVGLMLASSAGYNPRVGLRYLVYGIEYGESVLPLPLPECFSTVPSGKKRSQYLSQPKVLDKALSRYHQKPPPADST